jgi:hypothetical protein
MFTFIETTMFSRLADEYFQDGELSRAQHHFNEYPDG